MKWQPPQEFLDCAIERHKRLTWIQSLLQHIANSDEALAVEERVLRPLLPTEATTLQYTHCRSRDWMKIRLLVPAADSEKDQSAVLKYHVSGCRFDGVVVLMLDGLTETIDTEWDRLPVGLHSCLLVSNCIISLKARVHANTWLTDTYIGPGATFIRGGRISVDQTGSGVGALTIYLGPESGGGRAFHVSPESTMVDVSAQLKGNKAETETPALLPWAMNVVDAGAVVRDTPTLCNIYLHKEAKIEGAAAVTTAVLLPNALIKTNSTVESVFMQWSACIQTSSSVSESLLMESAVAGPHSICASSILGPDAHVSAGEVHASLLGPNTNAHHQSLVISVLWPAGRGNVAYGANVGSNHTGRLPDQECVAGEGIFWGLGCLVKLPLNLEASPYSIVAAGTQLAPQRVALPFSLFVTVEGINQVVPGWILRHSPYTLARNQSKYDNRRKAIHHADYTGWKILRPQTISMCVAARNALREATAGVEDSDVVPLQEAGLNQVTEKGRRLGMEAYTECIQRFALEGLFTLLHDKIEKEEELGEEFLTQIFSDEVKPFSYTVSAYEWSVLPWEVDDEGDLWNYQRSLLVEEFPRECDLLAWIGELLKPMVDLPTSYFVNVRKSKARDDDRGIATIPGYKSAHVLVADDMFVEEVRLKSREAVQGVVRIRMALDKASPRGRTNRRGTL